MAHQSGVNKLLQSQDANAGTSTSSISTHAGVLAMSNYKGGDVRGSYTNGYSIFTQAGPFCGGTGYHRSMGNSPAACTAQTGGVGGGGGGCQAQSGSATATSGAGGSGLVIIFPLEVRG